MLIIKDPQQLHEQCMAWRKAGDDIALVPTMGYYHAGHEALMEYGRSQAKRLVVSLFVNPAQFGPNEDLEAYPRDFERDCAIAAKHGADVIFAPDPAAMYAEDHCTWVEVPKMASGLCGVSRPIHFRGVCTIVLKLFMLTGADVAIFGQKDWQQQAIIKRMARDLNLPITIEARPTTREADGLALSSRNVYMDKDERAQAPQIRKGLLLARELVAGGERDPGSLRKAVIDLWSAAMPKGVIDYLEVVDADTLEPLDHVKNRSLMACAVKLGKARLIDNIILTE